jgi:hypothetical protein
MRKTSTSYSQRASHTNMLVGLQQQGNSFEDMQDATGGARHFLGKADSAALPGTVITVSNHMLGLDIHRCIIKGTACLIRDYKRDAISIQKKIDFCLKQESISVPPNFVSPSHVPHNCILRFSTSELAAIHVNAAWIIEQITGHSYAHEKARSL